MTASRQELQELVDQLLEALGERLVSGQIVIHVNEARVQKVETNKVFRPRSGTVLDSAATTSA